VDKVILTDKQIEDLNLICYKLQKSSITIDKAILKLQGGAFYDWAALAFIIYMFSLQQGDNFQNVPLPHMDRMGWASGKYDYKNAGQCPSNPLSRLERETLHRMKQICSASADENGFIMSYDEALNLVKETYSGSMQITEDLKITDWQGAKKSYHAKGLGINIEDYGITQKELNKIRDKGGLIGYVQRGEKLPPRELVIAYQTRIKDICYDPSTTKNDKATYTDVNGVRPATVFSNKEGLNLISFDQITGDLITGDKQRLTYFENYVETNNIGTQKNNK
jgi:hypothetical protein